MTRASASNVRTVRIEKLAPTGQGIARTADGVGFIDRALPGELVETNVYEVRKRFWRGNLRAVLEPSADRIAGSHADCAGCDWSHFAAGPARAAKRELFLETMRRIGHLDPAPFLLGDLPVAASAPGYRLRTRLHAAAGEVGYFAPGSHRISPADACEAIAEGTRALLPAVREAVRGLVDDSEVAILETLDGSRRLARATASGGVEAAAALGERLAAHFDGVRIDSADGHPLLSRGESALPLEVGGRVFSVRVNTFFQGNRHLVGELYAAVAEEARRAPAGDALDAFGGAGLFAGSLLDAGHRVTSVEENAAAAEDARRTRETWDDRNRLETVEAPVADYLLEEDRRFTCVVADPPRTGLTPELARELARRAERVFIYVSCDPPTLARDLPAILAEGFELRRTRLFDLFAFTHGVEAVVALERAA